MATAHSDQQQSFVVRRHDEWIDLFLHNPSRPGILAREIKYDVWLAVIPIVLDAGLAAELTRMKVGRSLSVAIGDSSRSLYSLTAMLEGTTSPARAANIARCWVQLPMNLQIDWRHDTSQDMPVHAQLLGAGLASAVCLQAAVPAWLPSLIKASKKSFLKGRVLHWTFAETPLGSSCIAWIGPDGTDPKACLAISTCPVQFSRADDPDLSRARAAVEQLAAAWNAIELDPELAEKFGLHATGHEVLEIHDTLKTWMDRLDAAAAAGAASGLSTMQIWEQVRDYDEKHAAG